jgi:hypothetical protein
MLQILASYASHNIQDLWEKLEIEKGQEGLYFLLCSYRDGTGGDTCHFSIDEAKAFAKFAFGVDENDWEVPQATASER